MVRADGGDGRDARPLGEVGGGQAARQVARQAARQLARRRRRDGGEREAAARRHRRVLQLQRHAAWLGERRAISNRLETSFTHW